MFLKLRVNSPQAEQNFKLNFVSWNRLLNSNLTARKKTNPSLQVLRSFPDLRWWNCGKDSNLGPHRQRTWVGHSTTMPRFFLATEIFFLLPWKEKRIEDRIRTRVLTRLQSASVTSFSIFKIKYFKTFSKIFSKRLFLFHRKKRMNAVVMRAKSKRVPIIV